MWWTLAALAQSGPKVTAGAVHDDTRVVLYQALLAGALGDPEQEIRVLLDLANRLPPTDPEIGKTLYWLSSELFGLGRIEEAREAANRGVRAGTCTACRDLLETIEIDDRSLRQIPATITFDGTDHAVFHPWRYVDVGSISVRTSPHTDAVLEWNTTLRMGDPDRLVFGVSGAVPPPVVLQLEVLSHVQDALLDVVVEDSHGRQHEIPQPLEAARGFPITFEVDLNALVPVEADQPLSTSEITMVYLVDLTGRRSSGKNRYWIDDITLR